MPGFDIRPLFASLLGHVNRHPHLADTFASVSGYQASIQPNGDLGTLAAWVRSMDEVTPIRVFVVHGKSHLHLGVSGKLADGTALQISVVLSEMESDLLAVNTRVEHGDAFPVELLLRLVGHERAVAVVR